jgi:hypothetical protein
LPVRVAVAIADEKKVTPALPVLTFGRIVIEVEPDVKYTKSAIPSPLKSMDVVGRALATVPALATNAEVASFQ